MRMEAIQAPTYPPDRMDVQVNPSTPPVGEPVGTYEYEDADRQLLFQVRRFEYTDEDGKCRKTFRQSRPDGNGGWYSNVPPELRTIYNLPAVVNAEIVLVCEGEKDCDTATSQGFVATCNPMGAGKWEDRYSEFLRSKDVVIIPDADDPGEKHGMQVLASVRTRARSVKLLRLPFGKDLSEWIQQGGTADELRNLIKTTSVDDLAVPATQEAPDTIFAQTDFGNAERFVREYGYSAKYCHAVKKWYLWDGVRWIVDDTGEIYRLAKRTVRRIPGEAIKAAKDEEWRPVLRHALRSESASRVSAMLHLAQNESGIPLRLSEVDRDPMLLNVQNGIIDLRTCQLEDHKRGDLITKLAPVVYDANAECSLWMRFLNDITAGDAGLMAYLQRAIGYTLSGNTDEHVLFLLYGTGANGKSTFLEVLRYVMGDYAQTADFNSFIASQGSSAARNDLAKLHGARLVTATESEDGMRLAESVVKQITGGDTITARFLYKRIFRVQTSI
jgi:putative DNA primase/helicase